MRPLKFIGTVAIAAMAGLFATQGQALADPPWRGGGGPPGHGWGHPGRGWGPPPRPVYVAPPPVYYGPPGVSLNFRF